MDGCYGNNLNCCFAVTNASYAGNYGNFDNYKYHVMTNTPTWLPAYLAIIESLFCRWCSNNASSSSLSNALFTTLLCTCNIKSTTGYSETWLQATQNFNCKTGRLLNQASLQLLSYSSESLMSFLWEQWSLALLQRPCESLLLQSEDKSLLLCSWSRDLLRLARSLDLLRLPCLLYLLLWRSGDLLLDASTRSTVLSDCLGPLVGRGDCLIDERFTVTGKSFLRGISSSRTTN